MREWFGCMRDEDDRKFEEKTCFKKAWWILGRARGTVAHGLDITLNVLPIIRLIAFMLGC
jgi:hypothetical protein